MKLKGVPKYTIAKLITAKITFHLPQRCNECDCDYIIPLNDDQKDLRKYCFLCSKPSHTCPSNIISPESQSEQPCWICATCTPKHQSVFQRYLQNNKPPPTLSNQQNPPPLPSDTKEVFDTNTCQSLINSTPEPIRPNPGQGLN